MHPRCAHWPVAFTLALRLAPPICGMRVDPSLPSSSLRRRERHQPLPQRQATKLHEMRLGEGYLELPQLVAAGKPLTPQMLDTRGVYIVDAYSDLYIWSGQKSSRLVRAAAMRVATELQAILPRPAHSHVSRVVEVGVLAPMKRVSRGCHGGCTKAPGRGGRGRMGGWVANAGRHGGGRRVYPVLP